MFGGVKSNKHINILLVHILVGKEEIRLLSGDRKYTGRDLEVQMSKTPLKNNCFDKLDYIRTSEILKSPWCLCSLPHIKCYSNLWEAPTSSLKIIELNVIKKVNANEVVTFLIFKTIFPLVGDPCSLQRFGLIGILLVCYAMPADLKKTQYTHAFSVCFSAFLVNTPLGRIFLRLQNLSWQFLIWCFQ